jgi:primary-amine oxidase
MSTTSVDASVGSLTVVSHPLDPATAEEFLLGRGILASAGLLGDHVRFAYYGLEEPPKEEVLTHQPGDPVRRSLRAFLIDAATGASRDVVVSLTDEAVTRTTVLAHETDGQVPILLQDFVAAEEIVHADPGWLAAMARRGLTDVSKLRACPLTAGRYGFEDERGRRMVRVLTFVQEDDGDLAWAHPVDGVAAYVDLVERVVFKLVDELDLPVPATSGNYDDPAVRGPLREGLKPIEITQPEGASFTLDGTHLSWQNWSLRIGFDAREGLSLHQISYNDQGRERPIIYRASVPEMVVPYGDPSPTRYWQNYFDDGEYLVGRLSNSLELGCDCLGEISYLDATVTDDLGAPVTIKNAICIHEEDYGILWKHTDIFSGSAQTRRQRRLVVSFFSTVGNYDYGFYWYLYLDGTIELEMKLTGILFTSAYPNEQYPNGDYPYATEIAPGLAGPGHQHLFSARLDMMVDGLTNSVEEVDAHGLPVGPDNPYGNAMTRTVTRLANESDGRVTAPERQRVWRVVNDSSRNGLGQPVGYTLYPEASPTLIADPTAPLYGRAGFATKHLWVTPYDAAERYPAGDFVNQHPGGAGIPAFVAQQRSIEDTNVVLWHTFGPTHFPRPEDWPVMPVEHCGFRLKPTGFFDRNPTLDVPAATNPHTDSHCHPA